MQIGFTTDLTFLVESSVFLVGSGKCRLSRREPRLCIERARERRRECVIVRRHEKQIMEERETVMVKTWLLVHNTDALYIH